MVSARTVEEPANFNAPAVLAQPADAATDLYRDPQLSDLSVDVDVGDDARGAVDVAACYAFAEAVLDRVADAAAAERATSLRPLEPIPAPLRRLRRALKFESKFRGGFSTSSPWDQFAALWSLRRTHARLASSLQRWPPRRADDVAPEKKADSPGAGRDYYLFRKASEGVDDDEPAHPRSRAVAPAHAYRDCAPSRDRVDARFRKGQKRTPRPRLERLLLLHFQLTNHRLDLRPIPCYSSFLRREIIIIPLALLDHAHDALVDLPCQLVLGAFKFI